MIISHKHKFIFIKTKKVGGTSLEIALSSICGDEDILTPFNEGNAKDELMRKNLGFRTSQNYEDSNEKLGKKGTLKVYLGLRKRPVRLLQHSSCIDIKKNVSEEVWNTYHKFSIVRNPYDFAVSFYYNALFTNKIKNISFKEYLLQNPDILLINWKIITDEDGKLMLDQVLKYENLKNDLAKLSEKINLDFNIYDIFKDISAKTNRRPKDKSYTEMFKDFDEGKKLVEILSKKQLEIGNYESL